MNNRLQYRLSDLLEQQARQLEADAGASMLRSPLDVSLCEQFIGRIEQFMIMNENYRETMSVWQNTASLQMLSMRLRNAIEQAQTQQQETLHAS